MKHHLIVEVESSLTDTQQVANGIDFLIRAGMGDAEKSLKDDIIISDDMEAMARACLEMQVEVSVDRGYHH